MTSKNKLQENSMSCPSLFQPHVWRQNYTEALQNFNAFKAYFLIIARNENLLLLVELSVLLAEEGVDGVVETLGLFTGQGSLRVGAGEGVLAEDGLVAAEEGVLLGLDNFTGVVFEGNADVEDPAVVGNISVVTVGTTLAVEGPVGFSTKDLESTVGEGVSFGCQGNRDGSQGGGDGDERLHGDGGVREERGDVREGSSRCES